MQNRWLIVATAVAAAAAGFGAAALFTARAPLELRSGTALSKPRPLANFSLRDQHGGSFTRDNLEGRWTLLFAGFTNCPDICPTTLAQLGQLQVELANDRVQVLFLTVDPERDTPEHIAAYLAHFGPGLVGTTGTTAQVESFASQLGLAYVRIPGVGESYTVDHSAALVLIDPRARVAGYFTPPHANGALAADLAGLNGRKQ